MPQLCELNVYFGEEGGRALAEGLMAPWKKPLIQPAARLLLRRRPFKPELVSAFVIMRMSSSCALSLGLREADDGKRAGSVTEPDNSSASEAARERLSSNFVVTHTEQYYVARSRRGTLIMLGEEDRRMLYLW